MKNTKTIIFGIVSLVLIIGIIGATAGLLASGLKKADEMLDDAMGELIMGEDTTSPEGTETGSEPADPWADGKLTYADGELDIGYRIDPVAGCSGYSVLSDELKPDTKYKVSWVLDPKYESYDFYIDYREKDGVNIPYILMSITPAFDDRDEIGPPDGETSVSFLLNNSLNITTDSNRYIELMFLRSSDVSNEACLENLEIFKSLIVSFEIEEVV